MKPRGLSALALLATSLSAVAAPPTESTSLQIVLPDRHISVTLDELRARLTVVTVTVDDPVYRSRKTYDGFDLRDVLALAGPLPPDADELVFQAKDGYAPVAPASALKEHRAILAFRVHGQSRDWEPVPQGKAMISPGPYYVVWEEGKNLPESLPWPYQLVGIEAVSFARAYDRLFPKGVADQSPVKRGFLRFKDDCIRCHSINLQGGDLGPELNTPKSILEYWDPKTARKFIRSPSSFRARSKMPPFTRLTESDLDDLFAYLDFMKAHKTP